MNNKFNSLFILSLLASCLASCESHEIKADEPFDTFKEQKLAFKDSNIHAVDSVIIPKKIIVIKKAEITDEWEKLKNQLEKKIKINENIIKDFKKNSSANSKILKQLARLEEENNNLTIKIDEYCIELTLKLEKFKIKINQNVNELDNELKDFKLANKE
jgi:hypothetical protein